MSTLDFLFSNQAPSVWTSPSYSSTTSPDWWQAASKGLITKASEIAGQDYQPYTGPRIAQLDPLQKNAIENANAYAPAVNETFNNATTATQQAGNLFNQGDFNQFMSPYTEGVTKRIAELGQRNLSENLLPAVNDTFIKAGQFGGSRNADFTLRALRDTNESIMGQQAASLEQAQRDAMGNYQTAQSRQLDSGKTLGALGQLQGQEGRAQGQNAVQMGDINRNMQQANLDLARTDFENQQNYPKQQLQFLDQITKGYAPTGGTTTSYASTPTTGGASPLSTIGGILSSWNQPRATA